MVEPKLTHFDEEGASRMVDVGAKEISVRTARAEGSIRMSSDLIGRLSNLSKGNAYETARLAGIMAAKRTASLIPLCHNLPLDSVRLEFEPDKGKGFVRVIAEVRCQGRTGVEMEALTAVSVALLTLYDMCKSASRDMEIGPIRLLEKRGGKSGTWTRKP